ncbi:23S rRNA (guanosine(2251)-2'-O)-methyltransferase RlmB [Actinoalloteichus hymeniacidonis]|uniref:Group 3 rRNA methylase n=1 Tax=Actinoalloteichus hymeniacidonis TaxID=340345 RepID=A0AAC9MVI4_9PSEU|nr:23S rRNA (guanosine(2251)-2'-O)-methyltransferase RlmB [Actinoalloteichus hymeniacidonis]AOS61213.1 group 3 rRNA methylase [Actinoalloteichus hymeniacidonis]MBB5910785.1 23S rRNA (guanosine2251-2'-O)-methyltransferase [Actinoalloteichus hymeniacidonis]
MAGNSQRRGAMRKPGTKKGATTGSGGQRRKALEGRGPTPRAEDRPYHPAHRRAELANRAAANREQRSKSAGTGAETIAGRNPVVECLRVGVPATALYVASGIELDDRVTEAVNLATEQGVAVSEVSRTELDRITQGAMHQGIGLQVPPFDYAHPDDLITAAGESSGPPLLVALDGVTDPRNLGAVIRSAAAFGANGVVVPQRRSAGLTAVAWRTSAGTAARIPVAKATNLTRTLKDWAKQGFMIVGLDADGSISVDELELATGPLVVVVGSEGRGLSRLVKETCDETVSIPMSTDVESLNASVATGVVLAEVARRRRLS